jgi:hypothetical protein
MKLSFNVDKVILIKIYPSSLVTKYKYLPEKPERNILWGLIRISPFYKAGFYHRGLYKKDSWGIGGIIDEEQFKSSGVYFVDFNLKQIRMKPHIEIEFSNKSKHIKYFDTFGDAQNHVEQITTYSKNNFLTDIIE